MGLYPSSDVLLRNPITRARAGCCARAANGHAAALPSNEMNSRRLMGTLVRLRAAHYHAVAEERRCASKQKLRANVADRSNLVSRGWCSLTSSRPQRDMPKSLFWRQADAIGGHPTRTIISAVYHARIAPTTHLHAAIQIREEDVNEASPPKIALSLANCRRDRFRHRLGRTDCFRCRRNQGADNPCDEPRANRTRGRVPTD